MQKNAPKALVVILLIVIAALLLAAGSDGVKDLFKKDLPSAVADDTPPGTDINDENEPGENPEDELPGGEDPEDALPPTVYPKAAKTSDRYLFEQEIYLKGGLTLNSTHLTTVGTYIIITSASEGGDFTLKQRAVSVIKMAENGTLEKAVHLATEGGYLASQITSAGLAVAIKDGDKTKLFTVSYDLEAAPYIELPAAEAARIFPVKDGFIMLADGRENAMHLIKNGALLKSASVQSGRIIEVFETAAGYMIFVNGLNGYSVLSLDKSLNGYTSVSVPEKTVLKVIPVTEDSKQKYIVAEKEGNAIYIAKYTPQFRSPDDRICLGIAEGADIYVNGQTVFVVLKNESGRIYLSDLALNITMSSAGYFQGITELYGCEAYPEGYLILAKPEAENALSFIDLRNDGSVSVKTLTFGGERAEFLRTPKKCVLLFYPESSEKLAVISAEL